MISLTGGKSSRLQMTGDNDGNYNWRWKQARSGFLGKIMKIQVRRHIGIILINIKTKREVG